MIHELEQPTAISQMRQQPDEFRGKSIDDTAQQLGISLRTLRNYLSHLGWSSENGTLHIPEHPLGRYERISAGPETIDPSLSEAPLTDKRARHGACPSEEEERPDRQGVYSQGAFTGLLQQFSTEPIDFVDDVAYARHLPTEQRPIVSIGQGWKVDQCPPCE